MKALQYQGPRQLAWVDIPEAQLQEPSDAVVKPMAVASCDLDWQIVNGKTPFPAPFILGHEFVAQVLSVGSGVSTIAVGDWVSVAFQPSCGSCGPCHTGTSSACRSVAPTSMFGVGKVSGDWGGAFAESIRIPFADNLLVKLPPTKPVTWFPSASDNIADGYRAVAPYLASHDTTPHGAKEGGIDRSSRQQSVLILGGYDSIPLYATAIALALGASRVTYCTTNAQAADNAKRLGAEVELVDRWPDRLAAHDITVCAAQDARALTAAIQSTKPGGDCTSVSIFASAVEMPMRDMYMRGIHLHTGRVNGAYANAQAVGWIEDGLLQPLQIDTQIVSFAQLIPALLNRSAAKLIATP